MSERDKPDGLGRAGAAISRRSILLASRSMRLRRVTSRAAMRGGRSTGRSRLPAFSARPARRPARHVPPLASGGGVREFESLETEFQGFEFSRTRTL
jgi:hypothetical protein